MNKMVKEVAKVVAKAALATTTASANSTCNWHIHQPKFPERAKQLKK